MSSEVNAIVPRSNGHPRKAIWIARTDGFGVSERASRAGLWVWRPAIGEKHFESIRYSDLLRVADDHPWSKQTYNNVISVIRCAFEFGYRDLPDKRNPAEGLKSLRITSKDRAPIDPFTAAEAEALILALHQDWGEAQGNYDEFRVFTGLRPSEQIDSRTR